VSHEGAHRAALKGDRQAADNPLCMVWFYTRAAERLQAETSVDPETADYLLILRWPDGRVQTERFATTEAFQVRLDALAESLEAGRWHQDGPPVLLTAGWAHGGTGKLTIH